MKDTFTDGKAHILKRFKRLPLSDLWKPTSLLSRSPRDTRTRRHAGRAPVVPEPKDPWPQLAAARKPSVELAARSMLSTSVEKYPFPKFNVINCLVIARAPEDLTNWSTAVCYELDADIGLRSFLLVNYGVDSPVVEPCNSLVLEAKDEGLSWWFSLY